MKRIIKVGKKLAPVKPVDNPLNLSLQDKKKIFNRLSKAIGHTKALEKMIAVDRSAQEVLIQFKALEKEIVSTKQEIARLYLGKGYPALARGEAEAYDALWAALEEYVK
jgi:CsoR family transcriptional regulator, copper-sensing transcriptional repressor